MAPVSGTSPFVAGLWAGEAAAATVPADAAFACTGAAFAPLRHQNGRQQQRGRQQDTDFYG
ncbi:hypothetical protein ACFTAO_33120 [Paenibacillus rhizoplanae]